MKRQQNLITLSVIAFVIGMVFSALSIVWLIGSGSTATAAAFALPVLPSFLAAGELIEQAKRIR